MRYLLLILALLALPTLASAQIAEGKTFEKWPAKEIGFDENNGIQAVAELFANLGSKVKSIKNAESKVVVPFTDKDFGGPRKPDEAEQAALKAAREKIEKERGWTGFVEDPPKKSEAKTIRMARVVTGVPILTSEESGGLSETSYPSSCRIWVETFSKDKSGQEKKGEFLLFLRETADKDWTIDWTGFEGMASPKWGMGPEAAMKFYQLLAPVTGKQKLFIAYMMGRVFKQESHDWWNFETFAKSPVGEEADTLNPFFSFHLREAEDAVLKRATYLYCYLKKLKTPAKAMRVVEESLLFEDAAKRREKLQETRDHVGFLQPKSVKASKVKRILRDTYKALLKKE